MAWPKISRRRFLKSTVYVTGAGLAGIIVSRIAPLVHLRTKRPSARPNVVVLLLDALRADYVGCYGARRRNHRGEYVSPTPNIDRLAQKGTLCRNAYGHSTTLHSLFSLHSGQIRSAFDPLYENRFSCHFPTFPELFRDNGYSTATLSANPFHYSFSWHTRGYDDNDIFVASLPAWRIGSAFEAQNDKGEIFFQRFKNSRQPFMWYIHLLTPHAPYWPARMFMQYFGDGQKWDERKRAFYADFLGGKKLDEQFRIEDHIAEITPGDLRHIQACYTANVYSADWFVGEIVGLLKDQNLLDNTVLVILSDHGDEFLEHGGVLHDGSMYQEDTHIPLLFTCPRGVATGRSINDLVSISDVPATLLDFAGIQDRLGDGRSLRNPLMGGAHPAHRQRVFSDCRGIAVREREGPKDWKAIIYDWQYSLPSGDERWRRNVGGKSPELYDLAQDPGETTNLAAQDQSLVDKFTELAKGYVKTGTDSWLEYVPSHDGPKNPREIVATDFNRLNALIKTVQIEPKKKTKSGRMEIKRVLEVDKKVAATGKLPQEMIEELQAIGYLGAGK